MPQVRRILASTMPDQIADNRPDQDEDHPVQPRFRHCALKHRVRSPFGTDSTSMATRVRIEHGLA